MSHLFSQHTAVQASILIVDDVPENLALLHASLDQAGYRVLVTTDGLSAIEIAHQCLPDMILMDGNMPHMDGFSSCEQLKASPMTADIPIIFMTGLSETEYIVRGFQVGGVDYVTKPFNIEEVLARVKTHLSYARQFRQQRQAIDASEIAILSLAIDGCILWQTQQAEQILAEYQIPQATLQQYLSAWLVNIKKQKDTQSLSKYVYPLAQPQLQFQLLQAFDVVTKSYLIQIKSDKTTLSIAEIGKSCPQLTQREAEVCHWLSLGKTNKDIAEILNLSPRTVTKHLEHIFEKLHVENRTAVASYLNGLRY